MEAMGTNIVSRRIDFYSSPEWPTIVFFGCRKTQNSIIYGQFQLFASGADAGPFFDFAMVLCCPFWF